jgi:HSP20 family molecular chaperone IbpA
MSLFTSLIPSREAAGREADTGPALRPVYEIKETAEAHGLTVFLPGVAKDGLELTADGSEVRITGRRGWTQPAGWTAVYRESADAPYRLVLTHDSAIDIDKIAAELKDGVLRVSLPKAEALKPRKIAVA